MIIFFSFFFLGGVFLLVAGFYVCLTTEFHLLLFQNEQVGFYSNSNQHPEMH